MRRPLSLTLRLTLLFCAVSTGVLLVLGMLVGSAVERHFVEQDMELLEGKTRLVAHLLEQIRQTGDLDRLPHQLDNALVGHHVLAVLVMDAAGRRIFATPHEAFPDAVLDMASAGEPRTWQHGDETWRGTVNLLPTGAASLPPLRVAVAVGIARHMAFMAAFRRTLWLFVVIAAALAASLGWMVARHGLAPLRDIRAGAAGVTASHLDYRLRLESIPVELSELAETLNAMLGRLEDSFKRLKEFSSDLAHELRTPISNLMTESQVALSRARSPDEYREILASNVEEYERLARMIADMLFLAQADHGLIVPRREPVELAEQVRELFDFFDALAEEKNLQLELTGGGRVMGDKLMLRRALANVLSNAIRHTPNDGRIHVRMTAEHGGTRVEVENDGTPIPGEQMQRLFDRFYRADPSRHHAGEGAGLGLAIARSILRAHAGDIEVRSGQASVCFILTLGDAA